jgi:hypothetical protein
MFGDWGRFGRLKGRYDTIQNTGLRKRCSEVEKNPQSAAMAAIRNTVARGASLRCHSKSARLAGGQRPAHPSTGIRTISGPRTARVRLLEQQKSAMERATQTNGRRDSLPHFGITGTASLASGSHPAASGDETPVNGIISRTYRWPKVCSVLGGFGSASFARDHHSRSEGAESDWVSSRELRAILRSTQAGC